MPSGKRSSGSRTAQPILETGGVRHQVTHPDRLGKRRRYREVEVRSDVCVEVEFPLLDELHDGGPREGLGNRRDAEERLFRVCSRTCFEIGIAVTFLEEHVAIPNDRYHHTHELVLTPFDRERRVEVRRHVRAVDLVGEYRAAGAQ
jgi:hypothetical protein